MPKKIALVGLGWLGLPLGIRLQSLGFEVVGTTRSEEKKQQLAAQGIASICWDSKMNQDFPASAIFENTSLCILNFPPGKFLDLGEYRDHLVHVASSFSTSTKFIFVSTTGVYPDSMKLAREDNYDWSMNNDTNHIARAEEGLSNLLGDRLTIIRMAGLIGPNRHPAKFFAGRMAIPNGDAPVNLIHLNDCMQLIEAVIHQDCWGEIINGCSSEHPTRGDYYSFACEQFGFDKAVFLSEGSGKLIDNSKSKALLGITYQMDSPFDYWQI